jgi:hypothetical protein
MANAAPNAFGAQLAYPGRQTIAICEDGDVGLQKWGIDYLGRRNSVGLKFFQSSWIVESLRPWWAAASSWAKSDMPGGAINRKDLPFEVRPFFCDCENEEIMMLNMEFVVLRCVLEHLRLEHVQLVDNLRDGFRARNLCCGGGIRLSLTLQILAVGRAQWGRDIVTRFKKAASGIPFQDRNPLVFRPRAMANQNCRAPSEKHAAMSCRFICPPGLDIATLCHLGSPIVDLFTRRG